jgi:4-hydroxy-tetrahydrodipicolinate synthase
VAAFAALVDAAAGGFAWTCGLAERYAGFYWSAGARGFTSGLANVVPRLPLALLAALRDGDGALASEARTDAGAFEEIRARHQDAYNVPVVKVAMDALGLAGGPVRPPLRGVDEETAAAIGTVTKRLIERWGAR